MVHRDADEPSILWHTVVQIEEGTNGARVRHGVARTAPRQVTLEPVVAAPGIVRNLLEWNGPNLRPRDIIDTSCTRIDDAEVDGFLDHVLLNSKRGLPLLVITPATFAGDQPLVDGENLAQRLAAMVRVVRMTPDAARKLTDALTKRGFDRKFGVYDGGVRLYPMAPEPDRNPYEHYLWIGSRIASAHPAARNGWFVGEVATQILRRTVPPGYFHSVEHHDREERRRTAAAVLVKSLPPPPADEPEWSTVPEHALRTRQSELEAALTSANRDYSDLAGEYESLELRCKRLEEDRAERDQLIDELREDVGGKRMVLADLQERLDAAKSRQSGETFDPALRTALAAAIERRPTPEQSLLVIAALYPDRVIIHPKAFSSARESEEFKYPDKVFELLMLLAGPYWDALESGKGDAQAKALFGSSYSPKESTTTMANKRAADLRTVTHRDRQHVLWSHLKIGVKQDSDAETFRAHFEWLADERRILIGHCGPHLDLR